LSEGNMRVLRFGVGAAARNAASAATSPDCGPGSVGAAAAARTAATRGSGAVGWVRRHLIVIMSDL
jgi:hypothetical protein